MRGKTSRSVAAPNGLTAQCAAFVAGYSGAASDESLAHACRRSLLDWVGCTLGGLEEAAPRAIARALEVDNHGPARGVTALLLGAAGQALEFEQTHEPTHVHISTVIWPALAELAADSHRTVSFEVIQDAFVASYEVAAKVARVAANAATAKGWHATPLFGVVGAAAAAAKCAGLEATGVAQTISAAVSLVGGTQANFGTPAIALNAGNAAWLAVLAARLVESGLRASATGLDDFVRLFRGADELPRFFAPDETPTELTWNAFKVYPSALLTHSAVEAALALRGEARGSVAELRVRLAPFATERVDRPEWPDVDAARYSVQFCVGEAWRRGELGVDAFADVTPGASAEQVPSIAVETLAELPVFGAEVVARLADGSERTVRVNTPRGAPDRPLSDNELTEKFRVVSVGRADTRELAMLEQAIASGDAADALVWIVERLRRRFGPTSTAVI